MFDFMSLNKLLGESDSISEVMTNVYKEHFDDLALLKKVTKSIDEHKKHKNDKDSLYYQVFKSKTNPNNYASLVQKNTNEKRVDLGDFNKYISKILQENKALIPAGEYDYLMGKTQECNLLQRIANVSTSVIPHQLHLKELRVILENAKKYYPFIEDIEDKIIAIFLYKIPYYFGPMSTNSEKSNIVKKSDERITPWNYKDIIDDDATKINFMNRLTNNCRYLTCCDVLPKASLLYEEFMILDRLNVMMVNGAFLNFESKQKVLSYILSRKKTTINDIKKILSTSFEGEIKIDNIHTEVAFDASTHAHLIKYFDLNDSRLEKLIFYATIYADDKHTLEETLRKNEEFKDLSDKQIKCIKGLQTKKWAPLSKELLSEIHAVDENGVSHNIIDIMRESNENLQMVLNNSQYSFMEIIDQKNKEMRGETTQEDIIQEMLDNTPAKMRRAIHQAMLVLDDIVSITKTDPKKIFVEVTREDLSEKKKQKIIKNNMSRRDELINFIKALKNDATLGDQANKLLSELENEELVTQLRLKGKHLYLYFKQMGRDMYTGDIIDINDVLSSNKYDIDHIIPQSVIKDDSLDNTVLVERKFNQNIKRDIYPILDERIRNTNTLNLWKYLYKKGAISEKKYGRLTRTTELTLEEIESFVASQINVVNYANIVVRNIFAIKYPNTNIVFSKAQYPSYVRNKIEIAKIRELNDAHHAVDAYLNVVTGDLLSTRFSNVRSIYEDKLKYKDNSKTFNMERYLDYRLSKDGLAELVKKNCFRHDALVTYKLDYVNGKFYKATILKSKSSNNLVPLHTKEGSPFNDINKYGGYTDFATNALIIVEYDLKKKHVKKLENLKLMYQKQFNDYSWLEDKLKAEGATNIKFGKIIQSNQKLQYDNGIFLIYSNSEDRFNLKLAYQNYIDDKSNNYSYYLSKAYKHLDLIDQNKDECDVILNRFEKKNLHITKEMNYQIFKKLVDNCKNVHYDSCNFLIKVRDIEDKQFFMAFDLRQQISIIFETIKLMSRSFKQSQLNNFYKGITGDGRKTNTITNNKIYIIHESPTGLYSRKELI